MPRTASRAPRWTDYVAVSELVPALKNAKAHDIEAMGASAREFGFLEPVVIDERTGRLVSGHGRVEWLGKQEADGAKPPDGVTIDAEGRWCWLVTRGWSSRDDAHAHAAGIALNRVGERGGWVPDSLSEMLDDLADTPYLAASGWTTDELDALIASVAPHDPGVDPWKDRPLRPMPDPGVVVDGQVWQVGPHRLVVGDARRPDVLAALPEFGLLLTDPPYGIAYGGGGGVAREPIEGDDDPEMAAALLDAVLGGASARVVAGASSYVFLPGGTAMPVLLNVLARHGLHRWSLVWAKDQATFGRADFHQQHEHISYGWFPGPRRVPVEDRKSTTLLSFPRPRSSQHHPSEKPVALLQHLIGLSSHPGDVVFDPFAGSGSSLVAAAIAGRVATGVELRPEYARVAVDRLVEATGEPAEQIV